MKKILFIPLYLSIILISYGQNNLSIQYDYAGNLFNAGQYFDSITEFKRLLFFDSSGKYSYDANLKIGQSYKAGGRYDDAVRYFSVAELNAKNDDQIYEAKTEIIRTNILRRTTARALQLCDEIESDRRYGDKADEINYWRGWACIFADNWKNASGFFSRIDPGHELKLLADNTERAKVSVTFAKVISYILPGAGAIYCGKFLSGLMSLGWNVLAGYWTVNSIMEKRVFDGIAAGELVWLRFYRGAVHNAEFFAIEKNLEITNKSLRFLQNEYKGIKP